uniref:Uncharacterized protein n=1 Tax=Strombidium inclinatum TaxID=197538 RepID=A0A7S3IUH2_9SPIT|mmetsp:Transcript_41118/g.62491  ORF Transcript_41118/g.62491 Transcript_41118/m.62491 type:complete len:107 (+) Transcript_41118:295-615(+)
MAQVAPSSKLIDESGAQLFFTVPLAAHNEIAPLFKLVEGPEAEEEEDQIESSGFSAVGGEVLGSLKKIVSDCGISHSTLEEVFIKVTQKKAKAQEEQKAALEKKEK